MGKGDGVGVGNPLIANIKLARIPINPLSVGVVIDNLLKEIIAGDTFNASINYNESEELHC